MLDFLLKLTCRILGAPAWLRARCRGRLLRRQLASCGRGFIFHGDWQIAQPRNIHIGDEVYIGPGAMISINDGTVLRMGHRVMIGPGLTIMGGDHSFRVIGKPMRHVLTGINEGEIVLEDDVWCGANVTILRRVRVGEGTIVGAGSVVPKSLPPYATCVGNPCRPVRLRFSDEELRQHLSLLGRDAEDIGRILRLRQEETRDLATPLPGEDGSSPQQDRG